MQTWLDLTDRMPFQFDLDRMREDLLRLESAEWLEHYDKGLSKGWKAILLVSRNGVIDGPEAQRPDWDFSVFKRTPWIDHLPYFRSILDNFQCPQGRVRILKLLPGCGIGEHRDVGSEAADFAFNQVRLHVPIYTNDRVIFSVGGEQIRMNPGRLYYVNFTRRHFVRNDGETTRIHLVMDLKVNDWLRQFFPALSPQERIKHLAMRWTYPVFCKLRWWKVKSQMLFWKHYEGSWLQQTRYRLVGRSATK